MVESCQTQKVPEIFVEGLETSNDLTIQPEVPAVVYAPRSWNGGPGLKYCISKEKILLSEPEEEMLPMNTFEFLKEMNQTRVSWNAPDHKMHYNVE